MRRGCTRHDTAFNNRDFLKFVEADEKSNGLPRLVEPKDVDDIDVAVVRQEGWIYYPETAPPEG